MREQPAIREHDLRVCLRDQYDLTAATIEFLPLGLDTRAGVYRVVEEGGASYLLKAPSAPVYEPSCLVPRYLRDQGIAAVVAPLPTQQGALWTPIETVGTGTWAAVLYPFIVGESGWNPQMTDAQWQATGAALKQIHQVELPPEGFASLRKEMFEPTAYSSWIAAFEPSHIATSSPENSSESQQTLLSSWQTYQATIHEALTALETLAESLRVRSGQHVICHADLHPSNIIRNAAGQVFVVDWNDVMLAPKERDFIFIEGAPVAATAQQTSSPFFQGYGETEVDWTALTYYLWERIVQDVIECAQIVFVRDDLGEATKAREAQLFHDIFAGGMTLNAARAAEAHLRSNGITGI